MSSADPAFVEWRARPSRDSLRRLLEANQGRVFSLCFQVLRHMQDAEDAAQASLLEIARGVPRIREPLAFNSWLYRVCLNNALNLRRERVRRRDREERSAAMKPTADTAVTDDLRDAVHEALSRLDDEDRAIVVEHYFERETLENLGARRGISGVAAWKRIEHAKERMKRALAGAGFAVGMSQVDSALAAVERVPAPTGLSVDAVLRRSDLAPSASSGVPVRLLALTAAALVTAILTLIVISSRRDTALAAAPPAVPLKAVDTRTPVAQAPTAPEKPAVPGAPQEATSRVIAPDGSPVQGALVFAGRWYRLRGDDAFDMFRPDSIKDGVVTDEKGRYTLSTDGPFVTAWHSEYSPTTVPAAEAATLRMKARGAVRGRVVDSLGKPLEGIALTLDKRGEKATTDSDGRFAFDKVIAGYRGLILPGNRWIAVRVDPGETVNVEIGPGVDVPLDLSGHPAGPGTKINGGLMGIGRTFSLVGIRGETPSIELKGVIPGRYLFGEIRGARGWVDVTDKGAKVEFGSSTLVVHSGKAATFYFLPAESNEIVEVAIMKMGEIKIAAGASVTLPHLMEGDYEFRDREGVTLQKFKIGPGETRIDLKPE